MMLHGVEALCFDVFGTVVDWRSGVAREAEAALAPRGARLDWHAFADAWRARYQPAMEEVRSGRRPFVRLDVLHRENLEATLAAFGVTGLPEAVLADLHLAWHRLRSLPRPGPGPAGGGAGRPQPGLAPARSLARRGHGPRPAAAAPHPGAALERQRPAHGRPRPARRPAVGRDSGCGGGAGVQAVARGVPALGRAARPAAFGLRDGGRA